MSDILYDVEEMTASHGSATMVKWVINYEPTLVGSFSWTKCSERESTKWYKTPLRGA